MKKLIVASNNKGKLKEIKEILNGIYEVVPMGEAGFTDDIVEDGNSFYENALIKAKTVSEALNADALADDSGLCVEALSGEPGIYSARYSGQHGDDAANRAKLLKELEGKEKNNGPSRQPFRSHERQRRQRHAVHSYSELFQKLLNVNILSVSFFAFRKKRRDKEKENEKTYRRFE